MSEVELSVRSGSECHPFFFQKGPKGDAAAVPPRRRHHAHGDVGGVSLGGPSLFGIVGAIAGAKNP